LAVRALGIASQCTDVATAHCPCSGGPHSCHLTESEPDGRADLRDTSVRGSVIYKGTAISHPQGTALQANCLHIGGDRTAGAGWSWRARSTCATRVRGLREPFPARAGVANRPDVTAPGRREVLEQGYDPPGGPTAAP